MELKPLDSSIQALTFNLMEKMLLRCCSGAEMQTKELSAQTEVH